MSRVGGFRVRGFRGSGSEVEPSTSQSYGRGPESP